MARAKTAKAPKDAKAKPSEVLKAIPQGKLRSLLAAARSTTKDVASLTGTLREKIGHAVENDHLHAKAFSMVRTMDRMEPAKLADLLDHLEHYLDVSGLRERAASAPRLSFGPGEEDGEEDEGNVTHLHAAE